MRERLSSKKNKGNCPDIPFGQLQMRNGRCEDYPHLLFNCRFGRVTAKNQVFMKDLQDAVI